MPHEAYLAKQYAVSAQALKTEYTWRSSVHSHPCSHCAKLDVWYVPSIQLPEEIDQLIPTLCEENTKLDIWQRKQGNGPAFLLIRSVVEQERQTRYVAAKWDDDASEAIVNTVARCTARDQASNGAQRGVIYFCATLMFATPAFIGALRTFVDFEVTNTLSFEILIWLSSISGCIVGFATCRALWRAIQSRLKIRTLTPHSNA